MVIFIIISIIYGENVTFQ